MENGILYSKNLLMEDAYLDKNNHLVSIAQTVLRNTEFGEFEKYLEVFGLPVDNVIASPDQRLQIMQALPEFLNKLPQEQKRDARYLSKFIAGSAVGLFDASLNFVWNEVVLSLRKKVISYGLDYFFDNAIGATLRDQYKNEDNLPQVKDQTLLDTCKKLELISDLLHRKLCHILDMRNQIGSSHPNEYSINAYELLGWLQTCIQDVFMDNISESAVAVKSVVDNVKRIQTLLDGTYLMQFEQSIKALSPNMVSNLLNTLFGMFVSPTFAENIVLRQNITQLSKIVWEYSTDKSKYSLGEKIDSYRANLDNYKTEQSETFFNICGGKKYYSNDAKTIKLTLLCEQLETVHYNRDNYVNEILVAREIMSYIPSVTDIPEIRLETVLKIFLVCRIGNDSYYCEGVSPGASRYYDQLFKMLDQKCVLLVLDILGRDENINLLRGDYRPNHVRAICEMMKSPILTERCITILDYMIDSKGESMDKVFKTKEFKEIKKGLF
jgi:hypothetical protein